MIFPYINYTLHRKKHTHIENLKPPSKNYRHYRVKMNAYIENLNPQGSLPVETTETTGWKRTYPQKSLILPDSDYTLHREKHTHIENITPPRQNYRNYRVKTNTYIKNLNCFESLQQKLQKLQGENEHTPPEFFDSPWLKLHTTHREKHTHIKNLKPQSRNYRNYMVNTNAYIENLICWESFQ